MSANFMDNQFYRVFIYRNYNLDKGCLEWYKYLIAPYLMKTYNLSSAQTFFFFDRVGKENPIGGFPSLPVWSIG